MRMAGLISVALMSSCGNEFHGADGKLVFSSNLGRDQLAYSPSVTVAVGSSALFRAVRLTADGGAPQSRMSLADADFMRDLDAGQDELSGVIARAGSTTVTANGVQASDRFPLSADVAVAVVVTDPLLVHPPSQGKLWRDFGGEIVLVEGAPLFVETLPLSRDGGWLAHDEKSVTFSTDGGTFEVSPRAFGFIVTALDGGGDAPQLVDVVFGAAASTRVKLRRGTVDQVARVELAAKDFQTTFVLKATALLDGGQPLMQAPVRWSYDPRLVVGDSTRLVNHPLRRDLLALALPTDGGVTPDDAGIFTTTVTARIGTAEDSLTLHFRMTAEQPDAGQDAGVTPLCGGQNCDDTRPPGCAGCSLPGAAGPLWLVALALLRWRRARVAHA